MQAVCEYFHAISEPLPSAEAGLQAGGAFAASSGMAGQQGGWGAPSEQARWARGSGQTIKEGLACMHEEAGINHFIIFYGMHGGALLVPSLCLAVRFRLRG